MPGVAKVDYFGDPAQHVFIEISNAQLTRLAITPQQLAQMIRTETAKWAKVVRDAKIPQE